ncbi:MAG: bifunctional diguanylate cyclase/phosphodiesterase, partial [Pseudomonadota bacterium]
VILLHNVDQQDYAARVAEKVAEALQKPFVLQDHTLHISTSIGIAICPQDGDDAETLMKRADASMYESKRRGMGMYSFYESHLEHESQRRLSLETQLHQALENDAFELVYQPQHNVVDNSMAGVEALLRWHDKGLGTVSPNHFISVAEEIGLMDELDWWVMQRACQQIADFGTKGLGNLNIAINVSARHFMQADFVKRTFEIIEAHRIPPHLLGIEITEETFLGGVEQIQQVLAALREAGINITIDDFGTGYSSLNYLRNFSVDALKLDGCFVKELETSHACQGIVNASILLGQNLGLRVVAEHVENRAQFEFLKQHQCDGMQGYYFSAPLTARQLFEYKRNLMKQAFA